MPVHAVKGLIWSNITEYGSTFTYMAENDRVRPNIDVYVSTRPNMAVHSRICPYMAVNGMNMAVKAVFAYTWL